MNLPLSMALRPSSLVILLAYGALTGVVLLMPCWYVMVTHVEKHVNLNTENIMSQLQSETEVLNPLRSSSTNLARLLNSTLDTNSTSFSDIQTKVAPILFQAIDTLPYITEISYMGMEGLFFSYFNDDDDQVIALYSNSSSSPSSSWGASSTNKTLYYTQPVNRENGEVYGEAMLSNFSINASLIQKALNFPDGFSSLATKWSNGHDLLFLSSSRITRTGGVISLGFSANAMTDFVTHINHQGTSSYLATKDGKILVEGIQHTNLVISNDTVSFQSVNANGNLTSNEGTVSCKGEAAATSLNIQDTEYLIHCYPIDIMGIESLFVLAVPQNGSISFDLSNTKKGLALMIVMMVMVFIAMFSFLFINGKAFRREMHLCASLIKQMEATQQAERKNMNKSLAFASASHDIRNSLACLTALIEMSHELVDPNSELETNLKQMESCTQDLLGLLNSTLDTSKTEAGKMELQEEEFDVSNLLEDVADFHHPLGMEKGVDLVLDPCDGSVIRYSRVKGDRVKLKQVLCNLISNAVKFTDEGHITVRAWVQKKMQHDICSMDFIFEVDDTGKGIPKEKYISVFDNYVQVKETGSGQGGTGLGLGIVKSLVHLMHGDIGIMDKDIGEKGTCFRFNVHLTLSDSETMLDYGSSAISKEDLEYGPSDMNQANTSSAASNICSISPRLHVCSFISRPEASQVVLFLANEERRRTSQRFMESLEIKVKAVKQWKNLFDTLIKIKQKGHNSNGQSSPIESSDSSCWSTPHDSFLKARGVPMAGVKYMMSSVLKKTGNGAAPGFILIVIDANAGRFSELRRIVSNFKKDLPNPCKVVWLDNPLQRSINSKAIDENDDVISKPFHGSRLFQVIKLLPEYGGALRSSSSKARREGTLLVCSKAPDHQSETLECGDSSNSKPLSGRKFLLVEDNKLGRKVAKATLERLGATIDECENGEQAVQLVDECLNRRSPYDYILMDCHMPVMDGFKATRRIREMEMEMEKKKSYVVHIPIIALTGLTENVTAEAGNGMDFHIVKPINRENILKAIRHIHTRKSGIM